MNYTGLKLISLDTWNDPTKYSIVEFTCTKDTGNKDRTISVAERKEPLMKDFVYPDTPEMRDLLNWRIAYKAECVARDNAHISELFARMNNLKKQGKL